MLLLEQVDEKVKITSEVTNRARELESLGFKPFDAIHLACAEHGQADVFLTTDDKLFRRAKRLRNQIQILVRNPLQWIQEI